MLINKLENLVKTNNLTQAEFESINYKLSGCQARLFMRLCDVGSASTPVLRSELSLGNISDVAIRLNLKLKLNDDPRQVVCLLKPNVNKFHEAGVIGVWFLVDAAANESA